MTVFIVLCSMLTVISVCASLYAVALTQQFEKLRIHARDNEDALAKLDRELTSLRQSWGQRWKQLEEREGGSGYDALVMELLKTQLGIQTKQE